MPAYLALAIPAAILLSARQAAVLDLVALTIPIPWMLAKLGCLLNGCCYGRPTTLPWAVTFPPAARHAPPGVALHPTQLYEIGIMLILLLIFFALRSDRWRGTKLLWFLLIYGLGRAATDFFRGDTEGPLYLGLLGLTQLLSLIAAAGALVVLMTLAQYKWASDACDSANAKPRIRRKSDPPRSRNEVPMNEERCVKWNPVEGIDSCCADVGFSFGPHGPRPPWRLTVRMYFSFVVGNPPLDLLIEFDHAVAFRWEEESFGGHLLPDAVPRLQGRDTGFGFPLLIVDDSAWIKELQHCHPVEAEGKTHYAFLSLNGIAEVVAAPPVRVEWVPQE